LVIIRVNKWSLDDRTRSLYLVIFLSPSVGRPKKILSRHQHNFDLWEAGFLQAIWLFGAAKHGQRSGDA